MPKYEITYRFEAMDDEHARRLLDGAELGLCLETAAEPVKLAREEPYMREIPLASRTVEKAE